MGTTYSPGVYHARVTDYGFTKTIDGEPKFFLQFLVLKKVGTDGIARECEQAQRHYYRVLRDSTIRWIRYDLRAIRVEFEKPSQLDPQIEGAVNIIDREITVFCSHAEYKGETREEWDLRPRVGMKMSVEEVRNLDDIFGNCTKKQTPPRRNNSNETL
jgi:hypothetical protein